MQIKTAMRYHLTPIRMAIIKKTTNNRCWWRCGEKEMLVHCWWEWKLVQSLWKTVWRFLKNIRIEPPYALAIALLFIYLKKMKTQIQKYKCTPRFIAALFARAKIWQQPKCPSIDEWIKKMSHVHTVEYYSAIKKNKSLPFAINT